MEQALLNQYIPYSQEAEEAVIGAVIVNPASFYSVASFLNAEDFFILRHQHIWEALVRLNERGDDIDYITIAQELKNVDKLEEIGGEAYIIQLINNTPTSIHAEVYGRLVERAAIRRRLLSAADRIKLLALDEELTVERVMDAAETELFGVSERQLSRELIPMREALSQYYDQLEALMQAGAETVGLPTGFKDLDKLLGGLQKSDLLVFAGRPGMGKTSWLLSVALNAARLGRRVLIFTMEMGVDQIVQRMVSMEAAINSQKLRVGNLAQQEWAKFVQVVDNLSHFRVFIDDTPAMTPLQMRSKCFRLMREHGIDLVILDYMQLMNAGGSYENNRVQEISYISRSMKELARELNVPIISAAQLSRAVEQRQDKRPVLSDLRESGCLAGESLIYLPDSGCYVPIRELCGRTGFRVVSLNTETWKLEPGVVTNAFCTGVKPVYRLTTQLGRSIRATANHKFLTIHGWTRLDELTENDHIALPRRLDGPEPQTMTDAEPVTAVGAIGVYKYNVSRERAGRLAEVVNSQPPAQLAQSDVYWDAVASIEPDGESEVYDLTVQETQNFVSENIVVHNSIEQDSDIVMFLYRDEVYNEATEFPNQAEIIVAKHRNGPTGTISLYFDKSLTKFLNAAERSIDLSHM